MFENEYVRISIYVCKLVPSYFQQQLNRGYTYILLMSPLTKTKTSVHVLYSHKVLHFFLDICLLKSNALDQCLKKNCC